MAEAGRWKRDVQRQGQWLPAFVDDALDPSDPVLFVDDVVEGLELRALRGRGLHPAPPLRARRRPGVNRDRVIAADGPTDSLRAPMERSRLGLVCRAGFAGRGMTYAYPNAAFFLLSGSDPRHESRVALLTSQLEPDAACVRAPRRALRVVLPRGMSERSAR